MATRKWVGRAADIANGNEKYDKRGNWQRRKVREDRENKMLTIFDC